MSRSNPFSVFVFVCFILFGAVTISFSIGCPDCFYNNDEPMNGPASIDGRRTISIQIHESWGTTTNEQIWNATQAAKNGWNNATDSNQPPNKTGYYLDVQQGNQNAQIIIKHWITRLQDEPTSTEISSVIDPKSKMLRMIN
jgi:hypothetical protein